MGKGFIGSWTDRRLQRNGGGIGSRIKAVNDTTLFFGDVSMIGQDAKPLMLFFCRRAGGFQIRYRLVVKRRRPTPTLPQVFLYGRLYGAEILGSNSHAVLFFLLPYFDSIRNKFSFQRLFDILVL